MPERSGEVMGDETCDRCGPAVRGKVMVTLPSGRDLLYCQHHATEYAPNLIALGAFMYQIEGQGDVV